MRVQKVRRIQDAFHLQAGHFPDNVGNGVVAGKWKIRINIGIMALLIVLLRRECSCKFFPSLVAQRFGEPDKRRLGSISLVSNLLRRIFTHMALFSQNKFTDGLFGTVLAGHGQLFHTLEQSHGFPPPLSQIFPVSLIITGIETNRNNNFPKKSQWRMFGETDRNRAG